MSAPGRKLFINVDPDGYQSIASREDYGLLDMAALEPGEMVRYGVNKLGSQIMSSDFGPGDTVIFDSISSFNQNCLLDAIQQGIGGSTKFKPSLETPGLAAYGARTQNTTAAVSAVLRASARKGMHCFFTAHLDEPTTNNEGQYLYETLSLSNKTINNVSLAISEIWYMSEHNKERKLAIRACRGKQPMGTRLFVTDKEAEFTVKYNPEKDNTQPHSIQTWFNAWVEGGTTQLKLPK